MAQYGTNVTSLNVNGFGDDFKHVNVNPCFFGQEKNQKRNGCRYFFARGKLIMCCYFDKQFNRL